MRQEKTIKGLWAALDKNNLISKELGDILDSNFGHMDKKLYINESKNQARKSGLQPRYKIIFHLFTFL